MLNIEVDRSALTCKNGHYCSGPATALAEPLFHARAQEYRRRLSGKMKPLSGENIFSVPKAKGYTVTRKYDGEFTLLAFDGKDVTSVNPGGTVRIGLPAFLEAAKLLKKAKVKSCILATELYVTEGTSNSNRVHQVVGILRKGTSDAKLKTVNMAVFDILEVNDEPVESTAETFKLLDKWFGKGKLVRPVEHIIADKIDTVMESFTEWVIGEGAEGLVVRHDRAGWYKIKLRHNLDAAIIGFSEGTEDRKGMLHDLLVAVMRSDGTFHEFARVGGGFTEEDRKSLFEELRRRIVSSDYVAVNNDYVAYEMIAPGPVIEISCLDLVAQNTRGGAIKKMVLNWDGERYSALSREPLVSAISPQFIRMRDDKEANVEDVNIRQISELVEVADVDKPVREAELSPSVLLKRTVYVKTMRGQKMVRKLLVWKTNKEEKQEFPAYVVYLTDFSPNRQNPLERDIKISGTEAGAMRLFEEMSKKNFVSGWEKVK